MLGASISTATQTGLEGATSLHFAIFEDGRPKLFLDIADAVKILSRHMREQRWGDVQKSGICWAGCQRSLRSA